MKKIISMLLVLIIIVSVPLSVSGASLSDGTAALKNQFKFGEGPKVDGYSVDYRYFSPVEIGAYGKYPLVIWLHGLNNGSYDGHQITDMTYWSSSDFQKRFTPSGGAFILAPRAREELGMSWNDKEMLPALMSAINSFIEKNKRNIDLNRIYIGGFSMGGMMALEVLTQHPEMFAAAFPYCPATYITKSMAKNFKDVPVWITSCTKDPTVDYDFLILNTWENITETSSVRSECRLSTLTKACYPDGSAASSNHYAWFSVRYDMFSQSGGSYPYMSTVDGNGKKVTLTYPDGMISWLSAQSSDYGAGQNDSDSGSFLDEIREFIRNTFNKFVSAVKNAVISISI